MKTLLRTFILLLLVYTSASAQWTSVHTFNSSQWIWQPFPVNENIVWGEIEYNSGAGGYFRTSDGGVTWFNDTLPDVNYTTSINARSATTAFYAIGSLSNVSRVLKTTDGGLNWNIQSSAFGNSNFIDFIYFFDDNNGCVLGEPVGGYLEIYTTTNGGTNWIRVPNSNIPVSQSNELPIYRAHAIFSNTIWVPVAVSNSNQFRIYKSTDKGFTWTVTSTFTTPSINLFPNSLAFQSQTEGLIILSKFNLNDASYQILKTADGGNSWSNINFPLLIEPAFICAVPGTPQGYLVTAPLTSFGSAYTLDGGNNWQLIENSLDLCLPRFTSPISGWSVRWTFDASSIYKYSGPPLPVALTTFVAEAESPSVILKWTTASELNNKGFEIQRRTAESDFATIGFVKGEGTTTNQREYSYIDKELADGKYYYRLKQVDYNGTYEYSDVIEVDVRSLEEFALEQNYPNPFNPSTKIKYSVAQSSNVIIKVFDVLGSEIEIIVNEEKSVGTYEVNWNAGNLPSGVYFYRFQAGSVVQTRKMILLK